MRGIWAYGSHRVALESNVLARLTETRKGALWTRAADSHVFYEARPHSEIAINEETKAGIGDASVGCGVMGFYVCTACRSLATIVATLTTPVEDDLLEPVGRCEQERDGDGAERWDALRSASDPRQL